jgi:adenosylhomocysteine nucleosidase
MSLLNKRSSLQISLALIFILPLLLVADGRPVAAAGRDRAPALAILGIQSETEALMRQMTDRQTTKIAGVPFVTGKLGARQIVLARCGVGKVNAAMTATLLIDHFHPPYVVFTGSAGALNPDLAPGDVVIGTKTAQHDVGTVTARGMEREPTDGIGYRERNPMFFPADARLLAAADQVTNTVKLQPFTFGGVQRTPKIVKGVIVTGDVFVADRTLNEELHKSLEADAVEEEGAAVAQVCWEQHTPYLAIRSISDNANNETPANYQRFYLLAAENSARLVMGIVSRLTQ